MRCPNCGNTDRAEFWFGESANDGFWHCQMCDAHGEDDTVLRVEASS